jgi:hypothetical protein
MDRHAAAAATPDDGTADDSLATDRASNAAIGTARRCLHERAVTQRNL